MSLGFKIILSGICCNFRNLLTLSVCWPSIPLRLTKTFAIFQHIRLFYQWHIPRICFICFVWDSDCLAGLISGWDWDKALPYFWLILSVFFLTDMLCFFLTHIVLFFSMAFVFIFFCLSFAVSLWPNIRMRLRQSFAIFRTYSAFLRCANGP